MKCSNPYCNRGIGLVVYRCSKLCRDAFVDHPPKVQQKRNVTTYFEWLFLQPIDNSQLKLKPAVVSTKAR